MTEGLAAAPEWLEPPEPMEDWDDLPPEAYRDDLGLSPEDLAAWQAGRGSARAEDEAVTAALRAGTLESDDDDGVLRIMEAAGATGEDLSKKTDAQVLGVMRMCGEVLAQVRARMYESLGELAQRRPGRYWDRRAAEAELEREEPDGPGEIRGTETRGAPSLPRLPPREMIQETMLEMNWTEYRASAEAHRAVDLQRRLPAAFSALKAGLTDDDHVKIMYEYSWDLSDANARKLDARVSPWMEGKTTGQLRDRLRREVIRMDPDAAERRRKRNERNAHVSVRANPDGTGTFSIEQGPAAQIAAAKARVNAIAHAVKSAGGSGPVALLEAETALGLLLGTLPLIPPPADDDTGGNGGGVAGPCPPDQPPGDQRPGDQGAAVPEEGRSGEGRPDGSGADGGGSGRWGWPVIPPATDAMNPGCAALPGWLRPATPGRIKELVPWRTLVGEGREPGDLSWFGPVTPVQAREIALVAASDGFVSWRVIITDDEGRALGTALVRRRGTTERTPGMIDEVTLTLRASDAERLTREQDLRQRIRRDLARLEAGTGPGPEPDVRQGPLADVLAEAVTAANRAAAEASWRALLDAEAGGCAHTMEVPGYRVPGTLRRWITTRDRTCRNPVCRRRAVQCDQDHTVPYDQGGRTCGCDLGSVCRTHHQLKQLPGWHLSQEGGTFTWTTPAGLSYRKEPDRYPV